MVNENIPHKNAYQFNAIGRVHSCYQEKFGIPRQPGLVPEARASIEILSPYDRDEAFRGLESVSHIWLVFVFHQAMREQWRPTVRPPRLGGNQRIGVFATRSNFRPNPIGLSLVTLETVERRENGLWLDVRGADLLQGTPIIDIKPYLPYADSVEGADAGIANTPPESMPVAFSEMAQRQLLALDACVYPGAEGLIRDSLSYDPRPAYRKDEEAIRIYGCRFYDLNIRWQVVDGSIEVVSVERD
ncbi:MAG: tRNA (N6-threonylcarbamoyladenosine(37)-N6)-methyltransferase TrmO [Gammaproteobacteria bacterium]|nr:tRNA (N6-threonylcarbamoyladenosine(37)-N6)-methyltransferase TrmO [Gammaproteobacteria bacterium]